MWTQLISDQYVSGAGTYCQEHHAVHGERGVSRVEGQPAKGRQESSSMFWTLTHLTGHN